MNHWLNLTGNFQEVIFRLVSGIYLSQDGGQLFEPRNVYSQSVGFGDTELPSGLAGFESDLAL